MPYGTTRMPSRFASKPASSYRYKRTTAVRTVQKAARQATVNRARAAVRKPPLKKAILQNARAISTLKKKQLGPLQSQISTFTPPAGFHVIRSSPWAFHLNDPGHGLNGPGMYHINNLGVSTRFHNFTLYQDPSGYNHEQGTHIPQDPCYLVGVDLQFEFSGFVDNTHVRIDVIRQKKIDTDFWSRSSTENYLPQTLEKFRGIAGFGPEELNRSVFQVLKHKKIFMNSRASSNTEDTVQDRPTVEATTRHVKHAHLYVPVGRNLKIIDPDEANNEVVGVHQQPDPYNWSKMHPLSNIWVLISTDDATDFASIVTGDAVSVKVVRKCLWRDRLS